LDEGRKEKGSSSQSSEVEASTQHEPQEEAMERIGCIVRRNHSKSQIISDPIDYVQIRSSLKSQ